MSGLKRLRHERRASGMCAVCGKVESERYRCEACSHRHAARERGEVFVSQRQTMLSWDAVATIYEHKHGERLSAANAQIIGAKAIQKLQSLAPELENLFVEFS